MFIAIWVQLTERYFLYSHTGLWKVCRYTSTPVPLFKNFTDTPFTNRSEISRLKSQIASEPYIQKFLYGLQNLNTTTTFDEPFKQALFANWITNSTNLEQYKEHYARILSWNEHVAQQTDGAKSVTKDPLANITFGYDISTVQRNGYAFNIPKGLQSVLFTDWTEKKGVFPLLQAFADDLNITTIDQIRPPPPTKNSKRKHYEYMEKGMYRAQ